MWTPEYFVRIVELPRTVDGVVIPNDDGTFDIYLNSHSPQEQRERWLQHEVRHIMYDHFYSDSPVSQLEQEADGLPSRPEPPAVPPGHIMCFPDPRSLVEHYRSYPEALRQDYGF